MDDIFFDLSIYQCILYTIIQKNKFTNYTRQQLNYNHPRLGFTRVIKPTAA